MSMEGVRRRYSVEFKLAAVERVLAGEPISALARELGVRRKFLYQWRDAVRSGRGFPGSGRSCSAAPAVQGSAPAAARDGAARIKELEALVGRLTLENRFFKGALHSIEELRRLSGASPNAASAPTSKR